MNETPKPFYSAALLDPAAAADRDHDFTSLPISHVRSDGEAVNLAIKLGAEWLRDNGIDRAILHIVRDGHAFYSEQLKAVSAARGS
jgi:hypothetical protein